MRKLLISSVMLVSACTADGHFLAADVGFPSNWQGNVAADSKKQSNKDWWKSFKDENLNKLIAKAIENNPTKKIAEARIEEARASRAGVNSGLFPEINFGSSATRSKDSFFSAAKPRTLYEAGFDANYEIDLFGGTQRKIEAGDALIDAAQADYDDITLSLAAEVAREYTNYRYLQQQKKNTEDNVKSWEGISKLTKTLADSGLVNGVELARAENLYRRNAAKLPDVEKQLTASGYRLSVLLGEQAGKINQDLKDICEIPVAADLPALKKPASVIAGRPDVKAAERQLSAASSLTESAITDLYPKINLDAFFGLQDTSSSSSGAAWSFGGGIVAPILNFGKIESAIDASKAREKQAFYSYKQTVIAAVAEVETTLSNFAADSKSRGELEKAAESNKQALDLVQKQFDSGIAGYIDVLDAEIKYQDSVTELNAAKAEETISLISLYKSLGEV